MKQHFVEEDRLHYDSLSIFLFFNEQQRKGIQKVFFFYKLVLEKNGNFQSSSAFCRSCYLSPRESVWILMNRKSLLVNLLPPQTRRHQTAMMRYKAFLLLNVGADLFGCFSVQLNILDRDALVDRPRTVFSFSFFGRFFRKCARVNYIVIIRDMSFVWKTFGTSTDKQIPRSVQPLV